LPRATSLAAELKAEFNQEATLIRGSKGIFDVQVDGQNIFSKHKTGRFPNSGEVVTIVKRLQASQA